MVQRKNAMYGGRESVSVMKREVDSSILSGSTTPIANSVSRLLRHGNRNCTAQLQVGFVPKQTQIRDSASYWQIGLPDIEKSGACLIAE
jgi:hypothetical protein